MANYERDSDDNIDNDNKESNHSNDNDGDSMQYVMTPCLSNKSFMHLLMAKDFLLLSKPREAQHFVLDRYAKTIFQSIIYNNSTIKVSATGKSQFKALQYEIPKIKLDETRTIKDTIYFKSRMSLSSIGIIQICTLVGTVKIYVVDISIPFFLYLKDINILGIYLNNIIN